MKKILIALSLIAAAGVMAGCVEDDSYSSQYYSDSGYVTTSQSNTMNGYNRDYNKNKNGGYYSSSDKASSSNKAPSGGYGGVSSGTSSTNTGNGGYH